MTCVRYLAHCICYRDGTIKDQVMYMGTKRDMHRRAQIRVDSEAVREVIDRARAAIFVEGAAVKSNFVEGLLKPMSLVPRRVSA